MATVEWVTSRITWTQNAIIATEAAIVALVGGAQSYTLDTGQTRQVVTKVNLSELRNMLAYLKEQLEEQEAELAAINGTSGRTGYAVPLY